jgi:hypothetical protein
MEHARTDIVESGRYGTDERNCEAWAINESAQRIDKKTDKPVQIVLGWDCNPFDPSLTAQENAINQSTITQIADQASNASLILFERRKQHNTMVMWAGIITVLLVLAVGVPIVTMVIHGTIHIPVPKINIGH